MRPSLRIITYALITAVALAACSGGSMVSPLPGTQAVTKGGAHTMSAAGPTIQRPFSDYRNSQEGYFFFWLAQGPGSSSIMPNCTSDPNNYVAGYVDYLGFENDEIVAGGGPSVGTTETGTVLQSDNGDGTSTVKVDFYTKNAIATATCFNFVDFNNPSGEPLYFGHGPVEIANGAQPALASSHFAIVFTIQGTGPGAFIPNFNDNPLPNCPAPAPCLQTIKFQATAVGPLRSLYGVADGTPGTMSIAQTGTNHTKGRAGGPFPFTGNTAAAVVVRVK